MTKVFCSRPASCTQADAVSSISEKFRYPKVKRHDNMIQL